jgi:CRISPR/Cas system CMR-associated protein Cmr3 (group 5 of RAMP superfamily)
MISPCDLPFMTNSPEGLQILWAQKPERYEQAKGWLPESEWERYLQGQAPEQVVTSGKLFTFEPRFGIAIDSDKGTTAGSDALSGALRSAHKGNGALGGS